MASRRQFLTAASGIAVGAAPSFSQSAGAPSASGTEVRSMNGRWWFRTDSDDVGVESRWPQASDAGPEWQPVAVPHTWQTTEALSEYWGVAWYRRAFEAPESWADRVVRVEFEAVFHSARVWVNGRDAGEHLRKGYTAFTLDITPLVRWGAANTIVVRVNNDFDDHMLPRGKSSDWTHDGGIYRPVSLLVTPQVYIERVDVDAVPDLETGRAEVHAAVLVRNTSERDWSGTVRADAVDEATGLGVSQSAREAAIPAGASRLVELPSATIDEARLWHFDHPNLYQLVATASEHRHTTTFGIRSIEVRDGGFYLNGDRVRLMGVERMAGSNPEYGMAEPASWIDHDHDDMRELNCVFTRTHWQQDQRVLDYCDRHGMFIQVEVPTWGPRTFNDMESEPRDDIMQNGLEQLREMIHRDRNHPSVFSWGLCNEIGGQHPPAAEFARRLYEEAKKLDPRRLRSYASNSLRKTPEQDVASQMDFIEWNEYYESWYKGTPEDLRRNIELIQRAFPGKPIVISEYGWCACTPDRPEGDGKRIDVLRTHDAVFRDFPQIGGLIFFSYNDYRTHIGDKGLGVMRQRVHGVVDVYGNRKPSFEALRNESSPVAELAVRGRPPELEVEVVTRDDQPAYTLRGYTVRAVVFGFGEIPIERYEKPLPDLEPGSRETLRFSIAESLPWRVEVDVMRPTGMTARSQVWRA